MNLVGMIRHNNIVGLSEHFSEVMDEVLVEMLDDYRKSMAAELSESLHGGTRWLSRDNLKKDRDDLEKRLNKAKKKFDDKVHSDAMSLKDAEVRAAGREGVEKKPSPKRARRVRKYDKYR